MGKAIIVTNKGAGLYSVSLVYEHARFTEDIGKLTTAISALSIKPSPTESERWQLASYKTRLQYINDKIPDAGPFDIWCADYSEDIAIDEVVGIIEHISEQGAAVTIKANSLSGFEGSAVWEVKDGEIQKVASSIPSAWFYNLAIIAGQQRWRPRYRHATITALDFIKHTASIDFFAASSVMHDYDVNAVPSAVNVPITYLDCNSLAFDVGDEVIVNFPTNNWDTLNVIGFIESPEKCVIPGDFISLPFSDDIAPNGWGEPFTTPPGTIGGANPYVIFDAENYPTYTVDRGNDDTYGYMEWRNRDYILTWHNPYKNKNRYFWEVISLYGSWNWQDIYYQNEVLDTVPNTGRETIGNISGIAGACIATYDIQKYLVAAVFDKPTIGELPIVFYRKEFNGTITVGDWVMIGEVSVPTQSEIDQHWLDSSSYNSAGIMRQCIPFNSDGSKATSVMTVYRGPTVTLGGANNYGLLAGVELDFTISFDEVTVEFTYPISKEYLVYYDYECSFAYFERRIKTTRSFTGATDYIYSSRKSLQISVEYDLGATRPALTGVNAVVTWYSHTTTTYQIGSNSFSTIESFSSVTDYDGTGGSNTINKDALLFGDGMFPYVMKYKPPLVVFWSTVFFPSVTTIESDDASHFILLDLRNDSYVFNYKHFSEVTTCIGGSISEDAGITDATVIPGFITSIVKISEKVFGAFNDSPETFLDMTDFIRTLNHSMQHIIHNDYDSGHIQVDTGLGRYSDQAYNSLYVILFDRLFGCSGLTSAFHAFIRTSLWLEPRGAYVGFRERSWNQKINAFNPETEHLDYDEVIDFNQHASAAFIVKNGAFRIFYSFRIRDFYTTTPPYYLYDSWYNHLDGSNPIDLNDPLGVMGTYGGFDFISVV